MKNIKFLSIILFIPLLAAFYQGDGLSENVTGLKPAPNDPVALVKKIVMDVKYKKTSNQDDWDLAKTGTPLDDGGEVRTGEKSLALVLFLDGSLLRVRANSILHIYGKKKEKAMDKNTFIQKGLVGFDVKKQSADEEFKFTTPTVVASIRGTSGYLQYSEDSTFTMYLASGSAGLYAQSDCDSIAAGNTVVIRSNGQCISRVATQQDENTNDQTNKSVIKKIKIRTNKGEVNIEYYGPGN